MTSQTKFHEINDENCVRGNFILNTVDAVFPSDGIYFGTKYKRELIKPTVNAQKKIEIKTKLRYNLSGCRNSK